ncbi:hypothetical protein [Nonomuraea dietziae]|uniref:hypothetical protein n=1 Tax=Nonomuraea dietziae TaxID=65515 RepID=UPI003426390C
MIELDDCLSPHVAMPQRNRVLVAWRLPCAGLERVRTLLWTCACRATVYELCAGGGQAFIRRTTQLEGEFNVHETPPMSISEARALWADLLCGVAR